METIFFDAGGDAPKGRRGAEGCRTWNVNVARQSAKMLATSIATLSFVCWPALRTAQPPSPKRTVSMGTTTDFKVGFTLEYEGAPWKITEFQHIKPGKGAAFVRSKMKNIQNGATLEKTWRAGETFPDAQVDKKVMKFSYIDAEEHVFMDMESFEEGRIKTSSIDKVEFIKEEMELNVLYYKGIAIDVQIPGTMSLRVKSLESGGSGKDHLSKIVELENGMMMSVPAFIKEGDLLKIDTDKKEYIGRDAEGRNNA